MADIQHKDIPNAQLHEPKGVSSAVANRVYVSNGSGSGVWDKLTKQAFNSETSVAGATLEADGSGNTNYVKRLFRYSVNVGVLSAVSANTSAEQNIPLIGALVATDEVVAVVKPTHQAGLLVGNARIAIDDQLTLQFANITGSSITPTASETYVVYVWRR